MKKITFDRLSENQIKELLCLAKSFSSSFFIDSYEEMCKFYGGQVFEQGKNLVTFWEEDQLIGSIGVVTKEAAKRGEIFISGVFIKEEHSYRFEDMLDEAFRLCSDCSGLRLKLGIRAGSEYLIPASESHGFSEVYKLLSLKLDESFEIPDAAAKLQYKKLDKCNSKDFQRINNEAFLNSPNGSSMDDEELLEVLEEYKDKPELAAVAYREKKAVGIYNLSIKENVGWIDCIGVDPNHHGEGIGKDILLKSVQVLRNQKHEDIKLTVMSSNQNAVRLYLKNGFKHEGIISTWYEKTI